MAGLRTWSGRQALVGLLACFVALQALVAGLHAAYLVDLQLLGSDLSSICHGGTSDTDAPTQPGSDHVGACCLLGCTGVGQSARLAETSSFAPPALAPTRIALPIPFLTLLPSHLFDRAHRPRSPPSA